MHEEDAGEEDLAGEEGVDGLTESEGDDGGEHPDERGDVVLAHLLPQDSHACVGSQCHGVGKHRYNSVNFNIFLLPTLYPPPSCLPLLPPSSYKKDTIPQVTRGHQNKSG